MTRRPRTTDSIFAIHLPIVNTAFVLTAIFAAMILSAPAAQAQTVTVLHSFTSHADGSTPVAGVTLDRAGNFYGTTNGVESDSPSTVYKMTHAAGGWILSTLYTFSHPNDPSQVDAPVVIGPDGALYGTSYSGGQFNLGSVFSLRPPATVCKSVSCPWTLTTLHDFDGLDGTHPGNGNLVFDAAGNIYGTTSAGGGHSRGTVFKLTRSGGSWTESVLYSFTGGDDGATPMGGVASDNAGNLYGTTNAGGANSHGTVYELSPYGGGWADTTLYTFTDGDDGGNPIGGVAIDAQGDLYGTTSVALAGHGAGTVWELVPSNGNWTFTLLHSFSGPAYPGPSATPTLDTDGNVYGTSTYTGRGSGFGEVFKLTPGDGGWTYTAYEFDGVDLRNPECSVAVDANGNLYGTTILGGTENWGAVWEITP